MPEWRNHIESPVRSSLEHNFRCVGHIGELDAGLSVHATSYGILVTPDGHLPVGIFLDRGLGSWESNSYYEAIRVLYSIWKGEPAPAKPTYAELKAKVVEGW
jgi:hypothetical protein